MSTKFSLAVTILPALLAINPWSTGLSLTTTFSRRALAALPILLSWSKSTNWLRNFLIDWSFLQVENYVCFNGWITLEIEIRNQLSINKSKWRNNRTKWQFKSKILSLAKSFKQLFFMNVLRFCVYSVVSSDCFVETFCVLLMMIVGQLRVEKHLVDLLLSSQSRFLVPWRHTCNYKYIIQQSM